MKKYLLFIFIFISHSILAQDLLITKSNDSLNCKIVSEQGAFTLYKVLTTGGPQSRAISNKDILKIEFNYFSTVINKDISKSQYVAVSNSPNVTSFNFGLSFTSFLDLIKNDDPDFESFYKDLSNGYSLHAEIQQSLKKRIGLSLRYDFFESNAEKNNYEFVYQNQTYLFDLKDEISIHTLSPGLYYNFPVVDNLMNIKVFASYDHNFFDYSSKINNETSDLFGNKSGFSCGMGYEYLINEDVGVSFQLRYRASKLNKVTNVNSTGSSSTYELYGFDKININRISIGLNICLK